MPHPFTATLTAILLFSLLNTAPAKDDPKLSSASPESFAVIELFTSEGCSSCPPADQVLATLVRDARANKQRVFPVAFHVDYWNNLGWRDPFSEGAYSDRQRAYAQAFRLDGIYTPQMIVNGQTEFVGSNSNRAAQEIAKSLKQPATVSVQVNAKLNPKRDALLVDYAVSGQFAKSVLNLALAERGLETKVPRGENANRTLRHENVVRAFRTIPLEKPQGQVEIPLPAGLNPKNTSIVAYVQDQSMHTLGAIGVDLPAAD